MIPWFSALSGIKTSLPLVLGPTFRSPGAQPWQSSSWAPSLPVQSPVGSGAVAQPHWKFISCRRPWCVCKTNSAWELAASEAGGTGMAEFQTILLLPWQAQPNSSSQQLQSVITETKLWTAIKFLGNYRLSGKSGFRWRTWTLFVWTVDHPFSVDHTPPVTGNCWPVLWPFCLRLLFLSLSSFPFLCPRETPPAATLKKTTVGLLSYHFCLSVRVSWRESRHGGSFPAPSSEVGHVCWQADTCSTSLQRGQALCRGKSLGRAGQALTGSRSHLRPLCIPFKCQVCSFDLAPGARRSEAGALPSSWMRRGAGCLGADAGFVFLEHLLGHAWNLWMRLMRKLSGMEWMETQIWFLLLIYWSNPSMLSMYILDIYGLRTHH